MVGFFLSLILNIRFKYIYWVFLTFRNSEHTFRSWVRANLGITK